MKTTRIALNLACAAALIIAAAAPARSALLYTRTDYKKLYNQKVAVELELATLRRKFKNEKDDLESAIRKLQGQVDDLNGKLEALGSDRAKDRELCDARIAELEQTIGILKQSSSTREQDLVNENNKLRERYEEELKKLRDACEAERSRHLQELADLRKNYDEEIAKRETTIKNLNEELTALKKLTETQQEELRRMAEQAEELEKKLSKEIELGQIRVKKFHDKLIINLDDAISFESGSSDLKPEIFAALDKITQILVDYPEYNIVIEGHTDNVPIRSKKFRDNWQLSTERALSVLGYVLKNEKLNRERFGAAGYGEFHPIVNNDTPKNKALNRRVDIVVIPRSGK